MYLAYSYTYSYKGPLQRWKVYAVQLFTVLSYVNSAVNPLIYAFSNDFFKQSFTNIFGCRQPPVSRCHSSGTVPPRQHGKVSAQRQPAQCRPSRRRMTSSLAGRPDLRINTKT